MRHNVQQNTCKCCHNRWKRSRLAQQLHGSNPHSSAKMTSAFTVLPEEIYHLEQCYLLHGSTDTQHAMNGLLCSRTRPSTPSCWRDCHMTPRGCALSTSVNVRRQHHQSMLKLTSVVLCVLVLCVRYVSDMCVVQSSSSGQRHEEAVQGVPTPVQTPHRFPTTRRAFPVQANQETKTTGQ